MDAVVTGKSDPFFEGFGDSVDVFPIYDGDMIVGMKDANGNLIEGRDPNATDPEGNDDPILLRKKLIEKEKEKEEEEEDTTPNVFGGGQTTTTAPKSVVVDSPFTSNVGSYTPVGYDGGDLNALIARLTGIASPKKAAQGGVIGYQGGGRVMQALDRFLATA